MKWISLSRFLRNFVLFLSMENGSTIYSCFRIPSGCFAQNQVITPEVSILDEAPSIHTGRVISYPNKSVEIRGLVGEKVVMQCNVFNMPRSARVRDIKCDGTVC